MANDSSINRLLDLALEDGAPRSPVAGLFPPGLAVAPLSACLLPVAGTLPHLHPDTGRTVKLAHKQAKRANKKHPILTFDECVAIVLYTTEEIPRSESLYFHMNAALRDKQRTQIRPWRDYIWLLLHALHKLPVASVRTVFRGCKKGPSDLMLDLSDERFEFTWSSFSSTATTQDVMNTFVGQTGPRTLMTIELIEPVAREVRDFSLFPTENEVLLPPNMSFEVVSHFDAGNGLIMIQCKQTETIDPILNVIPASVPSNKICEHAGCSNVVKESPWAGAGRFRWDGYSAANAVCFMDKFEGLAAGDEDESHYGFDWSAYGSVRWEKAAAACGQPLEGKSYSGNYCILHRCMHDVDAPCTRCWSKELNGYGYRVRLCDQHFLQFADADGRTKHTESYPFIQSFVCFDGNGTVRMADGTFLAVRDLAKGCRVWTPSGAATVLCVVQHRSMRKSIPLVALPETKLRVTAGHAVLDAGGVWRLAGSIGKPWGTACEVFNFILDAEHVLQVDDELCGTLMYDVDEARGASLVQSLRKHPHWASGKLELSALRSCFGREEQHCLANADAVVDMVTEFIGSTDLIICPSFIFDLHAATFLNTGLRSVHRIGPMQAVVYGAPQVCPLADDIPKLLRELCHTAQLTLSHWPPLHAAAFGFWMICYLHPFSDGNGRVARGLAFTMLAARGAMNVSARSLIHFHEGFHTVQLRKLCSSALEVVTDAVTCNVDAFYMSAFDVLADIIQRALSCESGSPRSTLCSIMPSAVPRWQTTSSDITAGTGMHDAVIDIV